MIQINKIYQSNCLELMKYIPDNTVDSIVTDPPYGLKFMGKKWEERNVVCLLEVEILGLE